MTIQDDTASQILEICKRDGWYIAAAESLTGGLLADAFVRISGASQVFLGSAVTYDIAAKVHLLHVDTSVLEQFGAVCEPVARAMALGTVQAYANTAITDGSSVGSVRKGRVIGLSTTGVAGPGPDGNKPAGAVFIGLAVPQALNTAAGFAQVEGDAGEQQGSYVTHVWRLSLQGDRESVRRQVVQAVLDCLLAMLQ